MWKKRSVIDLFVVILDCRFRNSGERLYGIKKNVIMKKAMILAVAASAAMLSACHTSGKVDNFTINVDAVSSATTAVDVPYKVANGYFVRNDVKKLPNGKISKQKDFEASFGMAAVMGNDGRPTEIDFNNQYVIAVSKPATDRFTELEPVSLKGDGDGGLVFVYRTKVGERISYSMKPSLVVVVDNKYRGMVSIREEK